MGLDVRGIFLDMSKDFGKVWYDGLIFKLCQNVSGEMINILKDLLRENCPNMELFLVQIQENADQK